MATIKTSRSNHKWERRLAILCLLQSTMSWSAYAGETDWLPSAHEVFQPLQADPRELQFALRVVEPVSQKLLGEAAMGDYLGLFRRNFGENAKFQISGGGGVFGRFELTGSTNDTQAIDFFGNIPFDLRVGNWSTRFLIYHTSSHLGDDYLKKTGTVTEKHSWDNVKWLLSYDCGSRLRLYGGYDYVARTLPEGLGRNALQSGFELRSHWMSGDHVQFYWANDFQSWERAGWNPMFNSQAGFTVAKKPGDARAVSFFLEYMTGRMPQGQFYLRNESRWNLGVQFHLT